MDSKLNITGSIKELFEQLLDKKEFISRLSEEFGLKKESIRNHWFSNIYAIPIHYRIQVFALLLLELENQIEIQNGILERNKTKMNYTSLMSLTIQNNYQ